MMNKYKIDYQSPIGIIEITGTEKVITSVLFADREKVEYGFYEDFPEVMKMCYQQFEAYFAGNLQSFRFPYEVKGTAFQKDVWTALTTIPFAQTASYLDIAKAIDNHKAIRAVGSANSKNQISIAVPCHRIIGSNGKLTGYAGGLWRKKWLLEHETRIAAANK